MTVKMVQISQVSWSIISPSGNVLQKNITVHNAATAHEYVRKYVQSFDGWYFEVIPLKKEGT